MSNETNFSDYKIQDGMDLQKTAWHSSAPDREVQLQQANNGLLNVLEQAGALHIQDTDVTTASIPPEIVETGSLDALKIAEEEYRRAQNSGDPAAIHRTRQAVSEADNDYWRNKGKR